jgi:hypothetical protein
VLHRMSGFEKSVGCHNAASSVSNYYQRIQWIRI